MKRQLKSIDEVFSETWNLYKRRIIPIIVVVLLVTIISGCLIIGAGVAIFIGLGIEQALTGDMQAMLLNPILIGAVAAFVLLVILLTLWSQAATLAITVDQELGILGGLAAGLKYFFPMLWVGSLYCGIVMTGFSLFIVPGVILGLSLSLCFYIMIEEDLSGIDAVMASRLYMRGHWWNTFVKFLLIWLISAVMSLIPVVGQILSLIFTPFLLLYMVVVYRDLKEAAGEVEPGSCYRWLWVLMAAAGILLPLLGFVGAAVTMGPQLPKMIKEFQERGSVYVNSSAGQVVPPQPVMPGKGNTPAVQPLRSVDGFMVWRDPTGNTGNPLLDIKEVSAKSEQDELLLTVTLAQSFDSYFTAAGAASFDPLISFYLDTDMDHETGGIPFAGLGRTGYDMVVDVLLAAQAGDGNNGQAHVSLYMLNGRERQSLGAVADSAVSISGHTLRIGLPYILLHVAGKDTVRISYREASRQQGTGLAKDKRVPLQ